MPGTGADCSRGQSGRVWFLGATNAGGMPIEMNCRIPAGTYLFLLVFNVEAATIEGDGATEAEQRRAARAGAAGIRDLWAEIDGVRVVGVEGYREESPWFVYGPLPAGNVVQELFRVPGAAEGSTSTAVDAGYYLMIKPLPEGEHTVRVHGAMPIVRSLDGTIHLHVGAPRVDGAAPP
jgi:hypothetical protein